VAHGVGRNDNLGIVPSALQRGRLTGHSGGASAPPKPSGPKATTISRVKSSKAVKQPNQTGVRRIR
jgi:hypothetical protein